MNRTELLAVIAETAAELDAKDEFDAPLKLAVKIIEPLVLTLT